MKYLSLILLINLSFFKPENVKDYSGSWAVSGDDFENILTLEKVKGKANTYKFTFDCWRISYDFITKENQKFFGGMEGDVYVFDIVDNKAIYSDYGREYDNGESLYLEGEQRCKVYFEFNKNSINVDTEVCNIMYAGWGVSFDGEYLLKGED